MILLQETCLLIQILLIMRHFAQVFTMIILSFTILFLQQDKKFIGYIGFTVKNSLTYINININPSFRNKKYGGKFINLAIIYLKDNYKIDFLYSEIKEKNLSSKIFEKNNFKLLEKILKKHETILVYKLNMEEIQFKINKTLIENYPTYFIAELSCNHNQDKSIAKN